MRCSSLFPKIIIIVSLFVPLNMCFAVPDELDVSVNVYTFCNNNGVCELALGENQANCSSDCGCNNNGVCESQRGENELNCPLDCTGGINYSDTFLRIFQLSVKDISYNSASVTWVTNKPAVCKFFWGETSEHEKESISEIDFKKEHLINLAGLFPNTAYFYRVLCKDIGGQEAEKDGEKFTTLIPLDDIPPTNVTDFKIDSADKKLILSWKNPVDLDFEKVRIIRSDRFYPFDPWNGKVVYEGIGDSFVDKELENGIRYYYTVFAYDKSGNYSSGAVASGVPLPGDEFGIPPLLPEEMIPVFPISPEIEELKLEDFDFYQNGEKIFLTEDRVINIKAENPLKISIDYEKVPEVLKTIMITFKKGDSSFSFLLRVNKQKTVYEADLLLSQEKGFYFMDIIIFDYKNQLLKKIEGKLYVKQNLGLSKFSSERRWYNYLDIYDLLLLVFVIFFFFNYLLIRRKMKKRIR